jgi:membrane protease YdiL (CAAX protease family)
MQDHRRALFLNRFPLALFFLLALVLSGLAAWPVIAAAHGRIGAPVSSLWQYVPLAGPALAAVIVSGWSGGRRGLTGLARRLDPRTVPAGWLLASIATPLAQFGAGVLLTRLVDGTWPELNRFGRTNERPGWRLAATWGWMIFVAAGEVIAWRGYALPRLPTRHGPLAATIALTAVVMLWHLPMFWYREGFTDLGVAGGAGFLLGLLARAVVLTWFYQASGGSSLVTTLWHGTLSLTMAAEISEGTVNAAMSTALMIAAVVIVVAAWQHRLPLPRARVRRSSAGRGVAPV